MRAYLVRRGRGSSGKRELCFKVGPEGVGVWEPPLESEFEEPVSGFGEGGERAVTLALW